MFIISIRKFSKSHEWFEFDANTKVRQTVKIISLKTGTLGITKFAASALGDIIHVEMPAVGTVYKLGETAVSNNSSTDVDLGGNRVSKNSG